MTKAQIQDNARHQLRHLPVHRVIDLVVETMPSGFLLIFVGPSPRWESVCGMRAVACQDLHILAQAALRHMILFCSSAILGVM